MKIFIYTLTIAVLLFNIKVFSQESEKLETDLAERQRLVAELVKSMIDKADVEWININTLQVTLDEIYSAAISESQAEKNAALIAKLAQKITLENTFIKIIDIEGKERAYQCAKNNGEFADENAMITKTQELIAKRIKSVTGASKVKWINASLLEITMFPDIHVPKADGEKIADMLAPWVHENTGKPVCIKITDMNNEELAYKCVGQDEHI